MAKQIHIFVENSVGKLSAISRSLGDNDIDIKALTIQDRGEYGMIKLLVDKPEEARLLLTEKGYAAALKDILVVAIKDEPGGLLGLSEAMAKHSINVLDAYTYTVELGKLAYWCSEVEDLPRAVKLLKEDGFEVPDNLFY